MRGDQGVHLVQDGIVVQKIGKHHHGNITL
jgi:hypothetical protein